MNVLERMENVRSLIKSVPNRRDTLLIGHIVCHKVVFKTTTEVGVGRTVNKIDLYITSGVEFTE